jgi:hypothetical protein
MVISGALTIAGLCFNFTRKLQASSRQCNPGLGLVRLAVLLGLYFGSLTARGLLRTFDEEGVAARKTLREAPARA